MSVNNLSEGLFQQQHNSGHVGVCGGLVCVCVHVQVLYFCVRIKALIYDS